MLVFLRRLRGVTLSVPPSPPPPHRRQRCAARLLGLFCLYWAKIVDFPNMCKVWLVCPTELLGGLLSALAYKAGMISKRLFGRFYSAFRWQTGKQLLSLSLRVAFSGSYQPLLKTMIKLYFLCFLLVRVMRPPERKADNGTSRKTCTANSVSSTRDETHGGKSGNQLQ